MIQVNPDRPLKALGPRGSTLFLRYLTREYYDDFLVLQTEISKDIKNARDSLSIAEANPTQEEIMRAITESESTGFRYNCKLVDLFLSGVDIGDGTIVSFSDKKPSDSMPVGSINAIAVVISQNMADLTGADKDQLKNLVRQQSSPGTGSRGSARAPKTRKSGAAV
jgi:hypothetical protein